MFATNIKIRHRGGPCKRQGSSFEFSPQTIQQLYRSVGRNFFSVLVESRVIAEPAGYLLFQRPPLYLTQPLAIISVATGVVSGDFLRDMRKRQAPLLTAKELAETSSVTLRHYDENAESFWCGTKDHDVSQNRAALIQHLRGAPPYRILDFGCGPGRDLKCFKDLGHEAIGLEGAENFVEHARSYGGCEVWHQDFLKLNLPPEYFDGIFANAALFHVPSQELPRVLRELWTTLRNEGVLFSSNPRGDNQEGWSSERYGVYHNWERWSELVVAAGFSEITHYYRPAGVPREQQPWLASVWRKSRREA